MCDLKCKSLKVVVGTPVRVPQPLTGAFVCFIRIEVDCFLPLLGKSTLLNAIEHLLGDYATVSPVSIICRTDRSKNAEDSNPNLTTIKKTVCHNGRKQPTSIQPIIFRKTRVGVRIDIFLSC